MKYRSLSIHQMCASPPTLAMGMQVGLRPRSRTEERHDDRLSGELGCALVLSPSFHAASQKDSHSTAGHVRWPREYPDEEREWFKYGIDCSGPGPMRSVRSGSPRCEEERPSKDATRFHPPGPGMPTRSVLSGPKRHSRPDSSRPIIGRHVARCSLLISCLLERVRRSSCELIRAPMKSGLCGRAGEKGSRKTATAPAHVPRIAVLLGVRESLNRPWVLGSWSINMVLARGWEAEPLLVLDGT
jgi:hypothetical protein